jgi:hypothetical protein
MTHWNQMAMSAEPASSAPLRLPEGAAGSLRDEVAMVIEPPELSVGDWVSEGLTGEQAWMEHRTTEEALVELTKLLSLTQ